MAGVIFEFNLLIWYAALLISFFFPAFSYQMSLIEKESCQNNNYKLSRAIL